MPRRPGPPGNPSAAHVALAEAYVDDILKGTRPACKWERLACERYRSDRKRERDPAWPYRFDPAAAERVCKFLELLPHTKGAWAARHELLKLPGWQCFIVANVFGWLHKLAPPLTKTDGKFPLTRISNRGSKNCGRRTVKLPLGCPKQSQPSHFYPAV